MTNVPPHIADFRMWIDDIIRLDEKGTELRNKLNLMIWNRFHFLLSLSLKSLSEVSLIEDSSNLDLEIVGNNRIILGIVKSVVNNLFKRYILHRTTLVLTQNKVNLTPQQELREKVMFLGFAICKLLNKSAKHKKPAKVFVYKTLRGLQRDMTPEEYESDSVVPRQFQLINRGGLTIPHKGLDVWISSVLTMIRTFTNIERDGPNGFSVPANMVMSSLTLKEQFNIAWLKIFSDQTSISLNTLLRDEVMKELLEKVIRSRICVYVKKYKDTFLSRYANKDIKMMRRVSSKAAGGKGKKTKLVKVVAISDSSTGTF